MASPPPPPPPSPPLQQFAAPSEDPIDRDPSSSSSSSSSSSFAHSSHHSNGLKQKDRIAEEEGVCLVAYSNDDHRVGLRDGSMGLMPHDFHSGSLEGREREQQEEDDDMVQEKAKMNLKSSNPKNPRRGRSDLVGGVGGRREDLAEDGEGSAQGAVVLPSPVLAGVVVRVRGQQGGGVVVSRIQAMEAERLQAEAIRLAIRGGGSAGTERLHRHPHSGRFLPRHRSRSSLRPVRSLQRLPRPRPQDLQEPPVEHVKVGLPPHHDRDHLRLHPLLLDPPVRRRRRLDPDPRAREHAPERLLEGVGMDNGGEGDGAARVGGFVNPDDPVGGENEEAGSENGEGGVLLGLEVDGGEVGGGGEGEAGRRGFR